MRGAIVRHDVELCVFILVSLSNFVYGLQYMSACGTLITCTYIKVNMQQQIVAHCMQSINIKIAKYASGIFKRGHYLHAVSYNLNYSVRLFCRCGTYTTINYMTLYNVHANVLK